QLDAVDGKGVDGVPILDWAAAPRGIVEPDAVDQEQVLPSGEAADERRAVAVGRFLNEDAGNELQRFRERPAGVFGYEAGVNAVHPVGAVAFPDLGAGGGENERVERVLAVGDEREEDEWESIL